MSYQPHIGMPVVCINDAWQLGPLDRDGIVFPVKGKIYTIREIDTYANLHLRFAEVVNPKKPSFLGPFEAAFGAQNFRPVQKRATDISIFQSLLTPSPSEIAEVQLEDSVAEFEELVHLGEGLLR